MFRPTGRIGLGGLVLVVAICWTVRADEPLVDVTVDLPPPTKFSHILDDLQDELDKIESRTILQRSRELTPGEQGNIDAASKKIVELLKILMGKKDPELLELYDDPALRDRLANFADAEDRRPYAFEDVPQKEAEKRRGTIRQRIASGSAWPGNEKVRQEAVLLMGGLVRRIEELAEKRRLPEQIRGWIAQLHQTPEERQFARRELQKVGSAAVPPLVEMFLQTKDPDQRQNIRNALAVIGRPALGPLLACLDSDDEALELMVLDLLRERYSRYYRTIVPHLWYPSAARSKSAAVRARASKLLSEFLDLEPARLPPASSALTREAERYFNREVRFDNPTAVPIWRWEGKRLVRGWPGIRSVSAGQAEEYFGIRFARQALTLDPANVNAQKVLLGLAVERAAENKPASAPLAGASPGVAELVARSGTGLLVDLLDRALKERRTGLALPLVRALGDRADVQALRARSSGEPALVRALHYPSPRIQQAAAEALLRIPGAPRSSSRIVAVLARALSPVTAYQPGRKVLVAIPDENWRTKVADVVRELGAQPVLTSNARDALRHLRRDGEIQAILLDSTLPGDSLSRTLAQMRQDVDVAHLPILLAAVPQTRGSHDASVRYRQLQDRRRLIDRDTRLYRSVLRTLDRDEAAEVEDAEKGPPGVQRRLSTEERVEILRPIREKYRIKREEAARSFPVASALMGEVPGLEQAIDRQIERYNLETQVRLAALERYVRNVPAVRVVHPGVLTNRDTLEALLGNAEERDPPQSPEEQQKAAEEAARLLAAMSQGTPKGFDVGPAVGPMLTALRTGRIGEASQEQLLRAAARFPGEQAQPVLAAVVLDGRRSLNLRTAGVDALILNVQRNGVLLAPEDIGSLRDMAATPGLFPALRQKLQALLGALAPGERQTGELLSRFRPGPGK